MCVQAADLLPPGRRPLSPKVHALVGGKVVVRPGTILDSATVIIRDGLIEAAGCDVQPPADARVWDVKGCTVYAGFIDPYLTMKPKSAGEALARSQPELTSGVATFFGVPVDERVRDRTGDTNEGPRIAPERRMSESYASDAKSLETLHEIGFTAANVVPERGILRGTSVLVALSDGKPHEVVLKADVFQHAAFEPGGSGRGAYPVSLMGLIAALRQSLLDADHYAREHAEYSARPNGRTRPQFNRSLEALKPALDKQWPVVFEPKSALMVERAARLGAEFGLNVLVLASGQEWRRPELAKAVGSPFIVSLNFPEVPKLPDEDDWSAVSLDQFRVWDWAPENAAVLRQNGIEIALTTFGLPDRKAFRKNLRLAMDRGLAEDDALAALTTVPARLCGIDQRLGTVEAGKIANLTVVSGRSYFEPSAKVREVWVDGRVFRVERSFLKTDEAADAAKRKDSEEEKEKGKESARRETFKTRVAHSPQTGRGPLASPRGVLVRGATIWTGGPLGRVENGSLLVIDGKVTKVGSTPISDEAGLPAGSLIVIDGQGKHVTPGIIDAHSHAMILGDVNESTLPSTAMVRIGDVVNSETENIYKQLAGGVTAVNLLHGSANPIGGQSCVIKLKEGAAPEELKMQSAPPGIKFALGENVKQSNAGERYRTRFPQTRMGVRTFFANRFIAAKHYWGEWENYNTNGGVRPRRDLELETIGEIIKGQRWVHCHSYRQDEILAFLRLMEQFGVRVATLQHVLEGYKVADEIARHGAGASCFSDWWAYKFEVYDAIPYAGSLMHDRGVVVSFNSDDADLARRLYLDAAKAVKYGGTSEQEAFKFVTTNPARQLRIDDHVGSLEPGKDGDFVVWSKSPLDSGTVCLETWIEGKKYFDRARDSDRTTARQKEWKTLLEKAKKVLDVKTPSSKGSEIAEAQFFEVAIEHWHDAINRHCED